MERVMVGMSGGVDSAVAAYLLKKNGYDVIGVTLRTLMSENGVESKCCEIDDARMAADIIGIPYLTCNCISEFKDKVIKPFMECYVHGLTPNPCIECNRYLKWEWMMYMMNVHKADYIATGHYASVVRLNNGCYSVKMADHLSKDQTYMLYKLTQEQLSRTLMPLGGYSKDEVRNIASSIGLTVADKPDSQEICFVSDDDHARFINDNYEGTISGEGDFVDEDGQVLGRHKGIINYTVGQRKGLGLPLGYPAYVKKINKDTNEVIIVKAGSLLNDTVICRDVNFMGIPGIGKGESLRCRAKIRYHHAPQECTAEISDEGELKLKFDEPVRAAAPGQSAVMYDEDGCVLAGGIIL